MAVARREDLGYFVARTAEAVAIRDDLAAAVAKGTLEREVASDRYTDEHVQAYWQSAQQEIDAGGPSANALIYNLMTQSIGDAVSEHMPDGLLDFGCAYGKALHTLALQFPSLKIAGVDRQTVLKQLNDTEFQAPNLTFMDGHVFDALPRVSGRSKLLVHVRTGIMVYPPFLTTLYNRARECGYRYVALYEIASLSCVSWTFRDQGSRFDAEAHRSTMLIHDYVTALREAGYEPLTVQRMPHGYALPTNTMLPGDTYCYVLARLAG